MYIYKQELGHSQIAQYNKEMSVKSMGQGRGQEPVGPGKLDTLWQK